MQPIDISRSIEAGALTYPGDPPLSVRRICQIGQGSPYNILELGITTHTLTHIDAPLHFFPEGNSIEEIPTERFMGDALVVEVEGPVIRPEDLPPGDLARVNLLFKTRNSGLWDSRVYREDYVYLSAEGADAAAARGVNLVGIDYLSIDRHGDESYPAHRILLEKDILILEGIDLAGVEPGKYTLVALPLRIAMGDGSPVRAVLIPQPES